MWKIYPIFFLLFIVIDCSDEANAVSSISNSKYKPMLISATATKETQLDMLRTLAQMADRNEFTKLVRFSVRTYQIVYETQFNGKTVKASGLLYIPIGLDTKAPLLALHHGTTFIKRDAPSTSNSFSGMEYFASAGYITIMPDYLGYGESSNIFHPYYDRKHSAMTVIDMIKSVKELLVKEKIPFNDQLFLAGYSEGGYVAMAVAKELETNPVHALKVTALAAGAGGYDLEEMLRSITAKTYYAYPSYLGFVLLSYNKTYQWNKPLTYFFQPEYAAALKKHMDGKHDGWYLNSRLTTTVTSLLDPVFYKNIKSGGEHELTEVLKDNSVSSWKSGIPIRLYHGTNDEVISYKNSEVTKQKLINAGSKQVELIRIEQGSHGSSFLPMLENFVPWFETLRKDPYKGQKP
jgi:alpha-beta hydrolase superfamily lysophospholipase